MSLFNFILFCWFTNIAFNILGIAKKKSSKVAALDKPLDHGKFFFDSARILGESTTWFGLLIAIAIGGLGSVMGQSFHWLIIAVLVYFGHALGSFIKRRAGFDDGEYLPIIDHGDYILLTGSYAVFVDLITLLDFILAFVITIVLTPLVTLFFHKVGLRERKL